MNGIVIQNGNRRGRCNARCWESDAPVCRCCCEGRFHHKGAAAVLAETMQVLKNERYAKKKGATPVFRVTGQLPLL